MVLVNLKKILGRFLATVAANGGKEGQASAIMNTWKERKDFELTCFFVSVFALPKTATIVRVRLPAGARKMAQKITSSGQLKYLPEPVLTRRSSHIKDGMLFLRDEVCGLMATAQNESR